MRENKKCLVCEKLIRGRTDKKFCTSFCRSRYHNHLRLGNTAYMQAINNQLQKNYLILKEVMLSRKALTISKEILCKMNFHFSYHTHSYTNKRGVIYYFCYDYGYRRSADDRIVVVRAMKQNDPN